MLTVDSPLALAPLLVRHSPRAECVAGVDLCTLVNEGLRGAGAAGLTRVELPGEPTLCAGKALRLQHLVTALLAIARRESPNGLGSELTVERLPTHVSVTLTSDRVTQTAELGPLFEAFNAYSSTLLKVAAVEYVPRMKITSCADRRFSRVRVGLPYAPAEAASSDDAPQVGAYEPCLRAG